MPLVRRRTQSLSALASGEIEAILRQSRTADAGTAAIFYESKDNVGLLDDGSGIAGGNVRLRSGGEARGVREAGRDLDFSGAPE